MKILTMIAAGDKPTFPELATSYAARPLNRFKELRPKNDGSVPADLNIQLLAGWGGACLVDKKAEEVREWSCEANLTCKPIFDSANQPRIGVCVNGSAEKVIGEHLQVGNVRSSAFGVDKYTRTPKVPPGNPRDTRISTVGLMPQTDPENSYVASQQEYNVGQGGLKRLTLNGKLETDEAYARRVREQQTGGFPGGSLRLAECLGLPDEASCGLLASSGFNECLGEVAEGKRTPDNCFGIYTNYSGVRACDAANPCRDDYICLSPIRYTKDNAEKKFSERKDRREEARKSLKESSDNRTRLGITFFGEKMPDSAWTGRNGGKGDRRGLCIPPYFVFQFKADGHKAPGK